MGRTYIKVNLTVYGDDQLGGIYLDAISDLYSNGKDKAGNETTIINLNNNHGYLLVHAPLEEVERQLAKANREQPEILDWRAITGRQLKQPQKSLASNFRP